MISTLRFSNAIRLSAALAALLAFARPGAAEQYPMAKAACTASDDPSFPAFSFTISITQKGDGNAEVVLTGTTTSGVKDILIGISNPNTNFALRKLGKPIALGPDGRTYSSVFTVKSGTVPLTGPKSDIGSFVEFDSAQLFGSGSLARCTLQAVL